MNDHSFGFIELGLDCQEKLFLILKDGYGKILINFKCLCVFYSGEYPGDHPGETNKMVL